MGLWDKIKGEFVDIVEWTDDSNDTMVYRFERYGNEIKFGAQLTVRQAQVAVFVNEGQCADIFGPGMYTLETQNLPLLSTLQNWRHGFSSPFKAEVYFISTRRFTDLKWGTKNPIMLRDPEFGPIRLRAFGTYSIRVKEADIFLREIVGTDGHFTTDEITDQLRNLIVSRFANVIGQSNIPALDLAGNYDQLGDFLTQRIAPEFEAYGLELIKILVENISLPPEVEKVLDKRSSMGVIGDLSKYMQYQSAEAIGDAATASGGAAASGMGMGMGFAMANQMAQSMGQAHAPAGGQAATPPPLPQGTVYHVAIDGKQAGPFDRATLTAQAQSGQLTRDSLVWCAGMANWTKAGEVADLAALFAAAPPPLPPAG
ncbi:MAG: SPFH domain-containing protein [Alphaproteobacteria bacterium]